MMTKEVSEAVERLILFSPECQHAIPRDVICEDCGHAHDPMVSLCPITCPACGHLDDIHGFDVLGADDNCLFCQKCYEQFDPDKEQP